MTNPIAPPIKGPILPNKQPIKLPIAVNNKVIIPLLIICSMLISQQYEKARTLFKSLLLNARFRTLRVFHTLAMLTGLALASFIYLKDYKLGSGRGTDIIINSSNEEL
jgi:hypothetical protein